MVVNEHFSIVIANGKVFVISECKLHDCLVAGMKGLCKRVVLNAIKVMNSYFSVFIADNNQ